MTRNEIVQWAETEDGKMICTDKRYRDLVMIQHQDGSRFEVRHAFFEKKDEWLVVFSEHHRVMVFYIDDLDHYAQYKRQKR